MITGEFKKTTNYLLTITLAGEGSCRNCGRIMLIRYSIGFGIHEFQENAMNGMVWQVCPLCLVKELARVEKELREYNSQFATKLSPIPT